MELRSTSEDNFDLDDRDAEDRIDTESSLRARLEWTPNETVTAVAELRQRLRHRDDDEDGTITDGAAQLGETYVYLENPFALGLDLEIGRQDFDDPREWLYDQNLDGVRLSGSWSRLAFELSAIPALTVTRSVSESSLDPSASTALMV